MGQACRKPLQAQAEQPQEHQGERGKPHESSAATGNQTALAPLAAGAAGATCGCAAASQTCEVPPDLEAKRLKALTDCRVLDTPAESRFDSVTKLLQGIFQTPMALVSLIDADRLVFHSGAGPTGPGGARIHSFCDASLKAHNPTMMVVEDTLADARFQHSQFVEGPPHVRFYAGAPLISSEGYVLGSLGILDLVPRKFPADMYNMICNFAELVVRELERDKLVQLQQQAAAQLAAGRESLVRAMSVFKEAIILCDLTNPVDWRIRYANASWDALSGIPHDKALSEPFWKLVEMPPGMKPEQAMLSVQAAIARQEPFTLWVTVKCEPQEGAAQAPRVLQLTFRPATNDHLGEGIPLIGIPNFVPMTGGAQYDGVHYFAIAEEYPPGKVLSSRQSPTGIVPPPRLSNDSSQAPSASGLEVYSGSSTGGSTHSCFSLERPEELKDLKLGPMLGKGSYGKVYRGLWRGNSVAVKVMDTWVDVAPDGRAVFDTAVLEAVLSRELSHPQVVRTYEWCTRMEEGHQDTAKESLVPGQEEAPAGRRRLPQRVWIIQELCTHGTLYDALDRGWLRTKRDLDGPTNMLALLQTAQEIASAMSYLHSRGILHGDLTGGNVLLASCAKDARRFTAMVGDFGLSRSIKGEVIGTSMGTVTHMPPETLAEATISKAVDVYSFGVLCWELYHHTRAWCGRSSSQVVFLRTTLGQELTMPEDAPPEFKAMVDACLHKDRTQRPTFDQLLEQLAGLLDKAVCS